VLNNSSKSQKALFYRSQARGVSVLTPYISLKVSQRSQCSCSHACPLNWSLQHVRDCAGQTATADTGPGGLYGQNSQLMQRKRVSFSSSPLLHRPLNLPCTVQDAEAGTPATAAGQPSMSQLAEGEVSSVSLGLSDLTQTGNSDDDPTPGVLQLSFVHSSATGPGHRPRTQSDPTHCMPMDLCMSYVAPSGRSAESIAHLLVLPLRTSPVCAAGTTLQQAHRHSSSGSGGSGLRRHVAELEAKVGWLTYTHSPHVHIALCAFSTFTAAAAAAAGVPGCR
jgi:hypothetical protein